MTYATQDDLVKRFGEAELLQLTDPTGGLGAIDAARVAQALADADRLIDGYCGGRYAIPLAPVPDLVNRIAADLARYYLHTTQPPELVKDNYAAAVKQLDAIAAGRLTLQAGAVATAEAADSSVLYDAPSRVFTGQLGGF